MIGRDKITVRFCPKGNPAVERIYYGVLVTDVDSRRPGPFGVAVTQSRLILPHTFAPPNGAPCSTAFTVNGRAVRVDDPMIAVYDGHGRIHHYEGVVQG